MRFKDFEPVERIYRVPGAGEIKIRDTFGMRPQIPTSETDASKKGTTDFLRDAMKRSFEAAGLGKNYIK